MSEVKKFHNGMGQAVAERTILRKKSDGSLETWEDVADRVALGNSLLCKTKEEQEEEYKILKKHLLKANTLMSGRHLQHGDGTQPERSMEIYVNCASASSSFAQFLLLCSGAGVGRCYDDDMMLVDWDCAPNLRCVLEELHPDFDCSAHESVRDAKHKYGSGHDVLWHKVEDTREGWAKSLEIWENAAFEKIHKDKLLILDFSAVRAKGSPIKGMQNRPASGPVPLMNAFNKAATLKGAKLTKWLQTIYIDHYFAECVLVGGARRSARIATKSWRDKSVLQFITCKRPIEYYGKSIEDILKIRKENQIQPQVFLWSANNSILVDKEFWDFLAIKRTDEKYNDEMVKHARQVFKLSTECAYADGTGEPGFINQDRLRRNDAGIDVLERTQVIGSKRYHIEDDTEVYVKRLLRKARRKGNYMITNPCGEIPLAIWGAFCTIADLVPFHCDTIEEAEECARTVTRAMIRVNTMDSIYKYEVDRTNRIGIGLTGVHEFAWKFFGLSFYDLIDESKSKEFWMTLSRIKRAISDESEKYSKKLGLNTPHTNGTCKPAGTTSKLFGLTEGWHLPTMKWYLRWVQFRSDDPLIENYKNNGYPVRKLIQYKHTTIVGFPTIPVIMQLPGIEGKVITAGEATPEEQYKWLILGEKYWLRGVDEEGVPLPIDTGGQLSYTLKYNPDIVSYADFRDTIKTYQKQVKCCSVMPQTSKSSYEYTPEEAVSRAVYEDICRKIENVMAEDVDKVHVDCQSGSCPIDFHK